MKAETISQADKQTHAQAGDQAGDQAGERAGERAGGGTGPPPPQAAAWPEGCVFLAEGARPLSGRQVGLVPGGLVPLLQVDLPERLRGFAREQVGFRKLRDTLAVRSLELRPFEGGAPRGQWRRALAVDAAAAAQWRRLAGPAGRAVLPDYLALPASPGLWVLAERDDTLVARLGPEDGFSAPRGPALRQLQAALETAAPRAALLQGDLPEVAALLDTRAIPVVRETAALAQHGIAPPRVFGYGELSADLRRDPGAARTALARRVLPWRWPVLAGLLAAGLWSAAQMLQIDRLDSHTRLYRDDTLARVRDSFVPAGPILDIRTQVSRALSEARAAAEGGSDEVAPLDLFERAAGVMQGAGAAPQSLSFTPAEGLSAVVLVADFAAAEALARALREAGLTVRLVEARAGPETGGGTGPETGGGVRAVLRLTPGPEEG